MRKKRKKIGVDIDDTLLDFVTHLCLFHNRLHGTELLREHCTTFDLHEVWGCTKDEATDRLYAFYHSEEHAQLGPTPGAQEAIPVLAARHDLIGITARPPSVRRITLPIIERHFGGHIQDFHFIGRHEESERPLLHRTKGHVCVEAEVDHMIEDSIYQARTVLAKGIPVLLLDTPWNQGELPSGITRVYGWDEVLDHL